MKKCDASVVLGLLTVLVAVGLVTGCATTPMTEEEKAAAADVDCLVSVRVQVPEAITAEKAEVYVGDKMIQAIALQPTAWHCVYIKPGECMVKVTCEGCDPFEKEIRVRSKKTVWLDCKLKAVTAE